MSYMLRFPPSRIPDNVRNPPYVIFAINGVEAVAELPRNIPLNLVLHFTPKMRTWILPPPATLPKSARHKALLTPFVGIDIRADMEVDGLKWIIYKMMQCAGYQLPRDVICLVKPPIVSCIVIYEAWVGLGLPERDTDALLMHLQSELMNGSPVKLIEIQAVWHTFPHDSPIVREMGLNFIRSYVNLNYSHSDFASIRRWYLGSRSRCKFFQTLEKEFPAFEETQNTVVKAVGAGVAPSTIVGEQGPVSGLGVQIGKRAEILEKTATRKVSPKEKRDREIKDWMSMKRRLSRVRSEESLRSVDTVIWNPPNAEKQEETPPDEYQTIMVEDESPGPQPRAIDKAQLAEVLQQLGLEPKTTATTAAEKRELRRRIRRAPERLAGTLENAKVPVITREPEEYGSESSRCKMKEKYELNRTHRKTRRSVSESMQQTESAEVDKSLREAFRRKDSKVRRSEDAGEAQGAARRENIEKAEEVELLKPTVYRPEFW